MTRQYRTPLDSPELIRNLDDLVSHLMAVESILDALAKSDEPRLAVINALGEVDTGLRRHVLTLASEIAAELERPHLQAAE